MRTKLIFPKRGSALKTLDRYLNTLNISGEHKFFILVDTNTLDHCLATLICNVPTLENAEFLELPIGENSKDIAIVQEVWQALMESGANRKSVIINLGGGAISDVGGFIAGTLFRGIDYINIPTTLIGMIDAAIGGKTAINLNGIKNPVGTFHTPIATYIHTPLLETLPQEEMLNGEFELVKTLLLSGHKDWKRAIETDKLDTLIRHCTEFKAAVVKADYYDLNIRRMLNLGHTFAHALESHSKNGDQPMPHGKAVGIGTLYALYLSSKKLGLSNNTMSDYKTWLSSKTQIPHFSLRDTASLLEYMRVDKKNSSGLINCVLLKSIGEPVIDVPVDENEIRDALLHA